MDNWDKAVKVFRTLADRYEKSELMTAQGKMDICNVGMQLFRSIEFPVLTNDEDVKAYIKKFQLQKPENMIHFFVEANLAAFESTTDSINTLVKMDLMNTISDVKSAQDEIEDVINDNGDAKIELALAKSKLDGAIENLQKKVELYIGEIRKIDNRSEWQFFLGSTFSLQKIKTNVSCAEWALRALIEAVEAQRQIVALKKQTRDPKSVVKCGEFIRDKILSDDTCSLMHAYDKNKEEGFWIKVEQTCKGIIEDGNVLAEYIDEYDDIDFS